MSTGPALDPPASPSEAGAGRGGRFHWRRGLGLALGLDAGEAGAGQPVDAARLALLAQLWSNQLQHMGTLGIGGVGGIFILVESGVLQMQDKTLVALAGFGVTALCGLLGQMSVIDDAARGQPPRLRPRFIRAVGGLALGLGTGALVSLLIT